MRMEKRKDNGKEEKGKDKDKLKEREQSDYRESGRKGNR